MQEHVETGGVTQFQYRRRGKGEHHRVTEGEEVLLGAGRQVEHVVLGGTFFPWLEHDEGHTRALAATGEVEAVDGEHRGNGIGFLVQQVAAHFVDHHLGPFGTGAGRGLHLGEEYALVFLGEEGGGDAHEQPDHADHDQQVGQQVRRLVAQDVAHATLVALHAAVEVAVEPAEEAALGNVMFTLGNRLEHGRAQRRGEDQGNQYRQRHGRNDGDRELLVDHPGGATEERHWQQYRREHHGDTDQRALDLAHGLLGGFLG
ncbi:hypothetical protein D3C81_1530150 [compost metagenome]